MLSRADAEANLAEAAAARLPPARCRRSRAASEGYYGQPHVWPF
jgi:hypothetical protein